MALLARCGLVALLGASHVFASPFVDELILPRATSNCPAAYTSKNSLQFTTYCEQNNPFNDAMSNITINSMEECMEHCSRFWGNGEGCFGVVWREDNNECWIRNSNTSTESLINTINTTNYHSALVDRSQMKALDEACPANDLSTRTLANASGIGYTVNCNKVIPGYDACWHGYPSCNSNPFQAFYHASSLDDCLAYCIKESPLCRAVSYNPSLKMGYANCWPKTGFESSLTKPDAVVGVIHTATITSIDVIDTKCPTNASYTSSANGNKHFEIHCGQLNTGTNITAVHMQNVTACMDACAGNNQGCVAVTFDTSLQGGYMNCYLQNTTSFIGNQASAIYAVIAGVASSSPPGSGSSSGSSSPSKAWIAGPVIGGIAALALIGAAIWWFRWRKSAAVVGGPAEARGDDVKDMRDSMEYVPVSQHPAPLSELAIGATHELDGDGVAGHAHHGSTPRAAPSELPS